VLGKRLERLKISSKESLGCFELKKHERRVSWAGHVARMGVMRIAYKLLVEKLEGKRLLGRPRHRCVDNIRMDLGEVGWSDVDWIGSE
jgi:hypothetical protein